MFRKLHLDVLNELKLDIEESRVEIDSISWNTNVRYREANENEYKAIRKDITEKKARKDKLALTRKQARELGLNVECVVEIPVDEAEIVPMEGEKSSVTPTSPKKTREHNDGLAESIALAALKDMTLGSQDDAVEVGSTPQRAIIILYPDALEVQSLKGLDWIPTRPKSSPELNEQPERIQVKKHISKIFTAVLAPLSYPEGSLRSITWDNFVEAMTAAGFIAQHSACSAVMFIWVGKEKGDKRPEKRQRDIMLFHRPHPDRKAPMKRVVLWAMGNRLRICIGWSEETFLVE